MCFCKKSRFLRIHTVKWNSDRRILTMSSEHRRLFTGQIYSCDRCHRVNKGTKLLLKVIKAIIIISGSPEKIPTHSVQWLSWIWATITQENKKKRNCGPGHPRSDAFLCCDTKIGTLDLKKSYHHSGPSPMRLNELWTCPHDGAARAQAPGCQCNSCGSVQRGRGGNWCSQRRS